MGVVAMPVAAALTVAVALAWVRRRPVPDIGAVLRSTPARLVLAAWVGFGVVRAVAVATGHASV